MRTSLIEIMEIEKYLDNELVPQDRLLFEARLEIDAGLKQNVSLQRKIYALLKAHREYQLRELMQHHYESFLMDSRNRNRLLSIFN